MRFFKPLSKQHPHHEKHGVPKIFPLREKLLSTAGALLFSFSVVLHPGCASITFTNSSPEPQPPLPASIFVRGWRAYFDLSTKPNLQYHIAASSVPMEIVVGPDSALLARFGLALNDYSNDSIACLSVPLKPAENAKITLLAYDVSVPPAHPIQVIDTLIFTPTYQVKHGSTVVHLESDDYSAQAPKFASSIDEINALPQLQNKVSAFLRSPTERDPQDPPSCFTASYIKHLNRIRGIACLLEDTLNSSVLGFHEATHSFFFYALGDAARDSMGILYRKAMDTASAPYYPAEKSMGKTAFDSRGTALEKPKFDSLIARLEAHPLFSLFDESAYYAQDSSKPWMHEIGHPYSGEHELFSGCSAAMRFFPRIFLLQLDFLKRNFPEQGALAEEIAKFVLSSYLPAKPFPPEIYGALGL